MNIQVEFEGRDLREALPNAMAAGLTEAAKVMLERGIVPVFGINHGGAPSAPGEPPHSQTGALRDSWRIGPVEGPSIDVFSIVDYSSWLETGTSKMAARPYMDASINNAFAAGMAEAFADGVIVAMKAGAP